MVFWLHISHPEQRIHSLCVIEIKFLRLGGWGPGWTVFSSTKTLPLQKHPEKRHCWSWTLFFPFWNFYWHKLLIQLYKENFHYDIKFNSLLMSKNLDKCGFFFFLDQHHILICFTLPLQWCWILKKLLLFYKGDH